MSPDHELDGNRASGDPLGSLQQELNQLLGVCDELEHVADELPDNRSPSRIAAVCRSLRDLLRKHHRHAESLLFPLLSRRALPEDRVEELARELRRDNSRDEGYALEVLELLDAMAVGGQPANKDTAGYLLRGFFEGLRRHLRCEHALLFPLARKRLTPDDLQQLREAIAAE
jgi:hemerythrin-like domain-containing protein